MAAATLSVLALAGTALSVGMSFYGQQQAGKAQNAAAKANAQQMEQTAKMREAEMHENIARGSREARRRLRATRATMVSSGTQLNDGSNQDALDVVQGRLNTSIADNARREQMEIQSLNHQANLTRWQGAQAQRASGIAATGTLLGGLGQLGGQAYNFNQIGAI